MKNLANNTGFVSIGSSQIDFSEAYRILPDPTAEVDRGNFSLNKSDQNIQGRLRAAIKAYSTDSMVKQTVDKFSEMFKAFDFKGGDPQVKYLRKRLTQMTLHTGEHWETFLTRVVTEYFKTGNTFIVKRRGGSQILASRPLYRNKPHGISALSLISCDRVEVERKDGEFIGWNVIGNRKVKIKTVLNQSNALDADKALIITNKPEKETVLIPGIDLVHIAYKKPADSNYGVGMTLPALEDISLTRVLEQITSVMMKKFSSPVFHHTILRPSSPLAGIQQDIELAMAQWRRKAPDGVIVTGANSEIKAIGSESQALRVEGYLKYFLHRALAGLGISPFLMGLEGGGQGTLEAAVELMLMKVRFCQAEIARELEMFLINEILWEGGFDPYTKDEDKVFIVFEDIDQDREIKQQTHAADMFAKNMWGHKEARAKAKCTGDCDDSDLFVNKIDIPKTKAEAEAKGVAQKDAGVAIAKARPKPKAPVRSKSAKEIVEIINSIIPASKEEIPMMITILENLCGFQEEQLVSLIEPIEQLLGDTEAIRLFLLERLVNANN